MIRIITLGMLTVIMGCSTVEQKITPPEPEIVIQRKVIVKKVKRDCAPIPSLKNVTGKKQFDEWVVKLVKLYKECAK